MNHEPTEKQGRCGGHRLGALVSVSRESSVRPRGGSRVRCHSAPPSSPVSPSAGTSSRPAPAATASPTPALNDRQVGTNQAATPGGTRVDIATGAPALVDPGSTPVSYTHLRAHET